MHLKHYSLPFDFEKFIELHHICSFPKFLGALKTSSLGRISLLILVKTENAGGGCGVI